MIGGYVKKTCWNVPWIVLYKIVFFVSTGFYDKTIHCSGGHHRFSIETNNTHFVKDHPRNISVNLSFSGFK
jgi:hypothetical protein